jgi:hypothetical protein
MTCYLSQSYCSWSDQCANIECRLMADEGDKEMAELSGLTIQWLDHRSTTCGFIKMEEIE